MERDNIADALADIEVQNMAMQQGLANMAAMLEKSTLTKTEEIIRSQNLSRLHYHFSFIYLLIDYFMQTTNIINSGLWIDTDEPEIHIALFFCIPNW